MSKVSDSSRNASKEGFEAEKKFIEQLSKYCDINQDYYIPRDLFIKKDDVKETTYSRSRLIKYRIADYALA